MPAASRSRGARLASNPLGTSSTYASFSMPFEPDPNSAGTSIRHELRKSEEGRFNARRLRIAEERTSSEFDPAIVGSLSLKHGIWWIALYQELDGARDFVHAAEFHLNRALDRCRSNDLDVEGLYNCFLNHLGLFFACELTDQSRSGVSSFDTAISFLEQSWQVSAVEQDRSGRTPLHLLTTATLALAALRDRPIPALVHEDVHALSVERHFSALQDALIVVVDEPTHSNVAAVFKAYRRSVRIADYRAALVRGLRMESLLAISTVAHGGDVVAGALSMFE